MPTYNELVDYQVQSMNRFESTSDTFYSKDDAPFDTRAYKNYKQLVDKEREQIDSDNLIESIYKLGYRIDTLLSKLIGQLDTIIESELEEENDNKEKEITVDPLTHKVTYNSETNVYNVVKREDVKW